MAELGSAASARDKGGRSADGEVALIGLREGSSFSWETRDGETRRLTVVRVSCAAG